MKYNRFMALAIAIHRESGGVRRREKRGLVTISQVGWREGVKEEIPNLLPYHAKALPKINLYFSISTGHH
jgi:hypothetical protein